MITDNGVVVDQILEYLRKELVLYESVYKLTVRQKNRCRRMTPIC
jgi:hypothetical protein